MGTSGGQRWGTSSAGLPQRPEEGHLHPKTVGQYVCRSWRRRAWIWTTSVAVGYMCGMGRVQPASLRIRQRSAESCRWRRLSPKSEPRGTNTPVGLGSRFSDPPRGANRVGSTQSCFKVVSMCSRHPPAASLAILTRTRLARLKCCPNNSMEDEKQNATGYSSPPKCASPRRCRTSR